MQHSDAHLLRFRSNYYNVTVTQSCARFTCLLGLPCASKEVPGSRLRWAEIRWLKNMPKVISDASIRFVLKNHSLKEFKNGRYSRFWPHLKLRWICVRGSPVHRAPATWRAKMKLQVLDFAARCLFPLADVSLRLRPAEENKTDKTKVWAMYRSHFWSHKRKKTGASAKIACCNK